MLGPDAGSGPTEEDRIPHTGGMRLDEKENSSEDKSNGRNDQSKENKRKKFISCISEATSKEALEEILSPPVASSSIDQIIRTVFEKAQLYVLHM